MEWITNRKPKIEELEPIFTRKDYAAYGARFLTWDGEMISIDLFIMLPKKANKNYWPGYWQSTKAGDKEIQKVIAWMPLPNPPKE